MTDTWTLRGTGGRPWAHLVDACAGMTAAWSDYAGFHVGTLPATMPPCSHVWAWTGEGRVLMRARLDGDTVVAGWLEAPDARRPDPEAELVEEVAVTLRDLRPWADGDLRVAPRGTTPQGLRWHAVDVETSAPITFVWAENPEPDDAES